MQTFYRINKHLLKTNDKHTFRSSHNYLILLLKQGNCYICLDGLEHLCLSPDILLFKPGQNHVLYTSSCFECSILSVSIPIESLIFFSDNTCNFYQKFQFSPYNTTIIHAEIESSLLITHLITKLASLKEEELQFGIELYEKSLFTTFLILFLRACIQSDPIHQAHQKKTLIIDNVFQYISHHLTEDLSLKTLEKEFFVSGEHISREFKKSTGITLHSYITRARIDLAKKYILYGTPISEVYHLCGFGSYNHFFKVFKKECHTTPMGYYQTVSQSGHKK